MNDNSSNISPRQVFPLHDANVLSCHLNLLVSIYLPFVKLSLFLVVLSFIHFLIPLKGLFLPEGVIDDLGELLLCQVAYVISVYILHVLCREILRGLVYVLVVFHILNIIFTIFGETSANFFEFFFLLLFLFSFKVLFELLLVLGLVFESLGVLNFGEFTFESDLTSCL